jgi:hypothetical protein
MIAHARVFGMLKTMYMRACERACCRVPVYVTALDAR